MDRSRDDGLDPDQHRIIEIATVVTDKELTVLAEGPVFAIHQPDDVLAAMDEWNTRQHANSGLTERVRASQRLRGRKQSGTRSSSCGSTSIMARRRFAATASARIAGS